MPNWKKVIVSGSNAVLNNITSSGNINASGTIISNNKNVVSQSGAFTNNEFIIAVGDGAVTSSDALAVDSDGNLGIGIPNPEVRLHMLGEDAQTTQILMEQFNNTTDAPDIRTRRYRGTSASRADVQTGDYLFRLNVHGQDDGSSEVYGSMRFDVDSLDQDALEWGLQTRDTAGTVADRIKINSSGDSEFTSNITASGNISSSGTLQGASLKVDDGTNLLGGKRFITSDSKYEFRDGSVHVSSGHITASGNISASGTITAATLDATAVSDTLAAAIVAEIDNDEIPIAKLAEDAVTVTAGTNLSNGGTVTLGGSITLNVDDAFLKNDADDTTSGTITSAGLIATKATDGGDTTIQIINSNTDGGTDKGAGIEFLHGSALGALSGNQRAGKILSTKASSYQGTTAAVDSNLEFYTANNDTDTLQLKIDNEGLAAFTGNVSSSGKVYSTNRKNLQCGFQSVGSAAQGTWYGPNSLGPNNTYWATPYGTAAAPGDVSLALGNSGWFVPVKAFVTDATLYIQNVSDPDNYAVTGALQLTNTISYPVTLTSSFSTTTDYTGDLYSTTGVQSAMEEVTITVNQQVDAGVVMYPRFNVNGVTSNWRGTFVVNYYEVK